MAHTEFVLHFVRCDTVTVSPNQLILIINTSNNVEGWQPQHPGTGCTLLCRMFSNKYAPYVIIIYNDQMYYELLFQQTLEHY